MQDLQVIFWFHAIHNQFTYEEAEKYVLEQIVNKHIDYRKSIIDLIDLLYDENIDWRSFAVENDFLDEQHCEEIGELHVKKHIFNMFEYLNPFVLKE